MESSSISVQKKLPSLHPQVFRNLENIKISKHDLRNLQTVSQAYYTHFNSIYINRTNRILCIDYHYNYMKGDPVWATILVLNRRGTSSILISIAEFEKGTNAYMFRELVLRDAFWARDIKYRHPEIVTLLSQLVPHIRKITLENLPSRSTFQNKSSSYGKCLADFLNQFPKLEEIKVNQHIPKVLLNELKIMLTNLKTSKPIKFQVMTLLAENGHCAMFDMLDFGKAEVMNIINPTEFPNVNFVLGFSCRSIFDSSRWHLQLKQILSTHSNVQIQFNRVWKFFDPIERGEFISLSAIPNARFYELEVSLDLSWGYIDEHDQQRITRSLDNLSPVLTKFGLIGIGATWDMLGSISNWLKLTQLTIDGYEYSLKILKHCPKLEYLCLKVNLDICIFQNVYQTIEEDLKEYFGNLKNLETLVFPKIQEKRFRLFERSLRMVLPLHVNIRFEYLNNVI